MRNLTYTVVLERNEDFGYTVTVPALKGCVTQGDSIADALSYAREAIECHLEGLHSIRRAIPADCKTLRLNAADLNEALIFKVTVHPEFEHAKALVTSG
jgi:predicted RNase H-like HicB family nuclease